MATTAAVREAQARHVEAGAVTAAPSRYIPALDGVRGVAILAVMAYHWIGFAYGWMGVDLFFALSGFLITGILLDASGSPRRHALIAFYGRRALRILPISLAVLTIFLVIVPMIPRYAVLATPGREQLWYWSYLVNWRRVPNSLPIDRYLEHYWSLAVEEQFYLVWPWVVWTARSPARLRRIATIVIVAVPLLRVVGLLAGVGPEIIYRGTPFRADILAAGGWLAAAAREPGGLAARNRAAGWAALVAGVVCAATLVARRSWDVYPVPRMLVTTVEYSALAICFAALLGRAVARRGILARALEARWLRWVGRVSYGLYILHFPVGAIVGPHLSSVVERAIVLTAVSIALAWASWRWFESPILDLKRYVPYRAHSGM